MLKKDKLRKRRKVLRVRKNIFGSPERPRLSVARSLNHIYAQLIDDSTNTTLAAASSRSADIAEEIKKAKSKTDKSVIVGSLLAKKAIEKGINNVVFDRGGYKYHGRIKAVAEGARKGGLKF